jgi:hypothetical protein
MIFDLYLWVFALSECFSRVLSKSRIWGLGESGRGFACCFDDLGFQNHGGILGGGLREMRKEKVSEGSVFEWN